jgi:O-antigen ligase
MTGAAESGSATGEKPARAPAFSEEAGRWCAVALGASIPISTAADNILTPLFALAWLTSGAYAAKGRQIGRTPVAVAALALLGLIVLGVIYGHATAAESWEVVNKYRDLLLMGLLLWAFRDPETRRAGLIGFGAALALTLAVSYLKFARILPPDFLGYGTPDNPTAFKLQVTHNYLVSFAAFLFALVAWHARERRWKIAAALLAGLATVNVLLMVQGRTGYLVLATLFVYLVALRFRWRGLVAAAALVAVAGSATYALSEGFRDRIALTLAQARAYDPETPAPLDSSVGMRLEFYINSLAIVREHPILGVGTGGFSRAYAAQVHGSGRFLTNNPHNEYLLMAVNLGLTGLAVLLALFVTHWVSAARLASPLEVHLARGLVLAIAAGCLVNSLLLDHVEGLMYAWLTGLLFGGYRPPARDTDTA